MLMLHKIFCFQANHLVKKGILSKLGPSALSSLHPFTSSPRSTSLCFHSNRDTIPGPARGRHRFSLTQKKESPLPSLNILEPSGNWFLMTLSLPQLKHTPPTLMRVFPPLTPASNPTRPSRSGNDSFVQTQLKNRHLFDVIEKPTFWPVFALTSSQIADARAGVRVWGRACVRSCDRASELLNYGYSNLKAVRPCGWECKSAHVWTVNMHSFICAKLWNCL